MNRKILVLYAHPAQDRSEVNRRLADATAAIEGVTLVDLYAEYPTFAIDIDKEQERLRQHDVIIFLHPLYWYSTPAILKEWQDLVLEHGFAYGADGKELLGKRFFTAITAGGSEAAYQSGGYNHFTIQELLAPLEQTARLCGMEYLPPFVLFSSRVAVEEGRVGGHVSDWTALLKALRDDRVDVEAAKRSECLSRDLSSILREV